MKRLFSAKKAGHTGSLDSLATGMLPICFGEATKFSHILLEADKAYTVSAALGSETSTGDREGECIKIKPVEFYSDQDIEAALSKFRGSISQVPPMYSALKYKGQPLYKLAREGINIERKRRRITIYKFEMLSRSPTHIKLWVCCSKGTYIRTLVEEFGRALGCCAHVATLHRDWVVPFKDCPMYTHHEAEQMIARASQPSDLLLSIERILRGWEILNVTDSEALSLYKGHSIPLQGRELQEGQVGLRDSVSGLIGIGEVRHGQVFPKRLIQIPGKNP